MAILTDFIGKVLEFTVEPVGREFGYVLFYNRNIKELEEATKDLEARREDVGILVSAAKDNMEEIGRAVQLWQFKVDKIIKKAEKFSLEKSHANTGCSYKSCPNLWLRYKLSRKAGKMARKVKQLNDEWEINKVALGQIPSQGIGESSVVGETFESRDSTMNAIMEALDDPEVHLIGLYGLGGVGKTTLAVQVAKKAEQEKLFDKMFIVSVKHNPIEKIQNQIADRLGFIDMKSESEEDKRADCLRQRLQQEKSLLIVLDDIWERLDFKRVGIPSADKPETRRKFIFTSRDARLLSRQMNCKKNIPLGLLSEEEAWRMFKKEAQINERSRDPDLVLKAKEVSNKCARLPVAIVAVARALRNCDDPVEWKDALRRLNGYSSRHIPEIEEGHSSEIEGHSSIKLSYRYLPKELQPIFLLSAMLSQDPLVMDLLIYAVGLGFLESVNNMEEARDALHVHVKRLKDLSLLLESYSDDRFTIHDVVRDVALSIAFEKQHALVRRRIKVDEWPNEYQPESCTAICLDECDIDELPEELKGPEVKFFYLNSKDPELNIPSNFFNGMQRLKVLSLSNMTFSSLPSSISLLTELETLSLFSCKLEDISVIKDLKKLKILNLSYSVIKQLPCELGQLSCLKVLNLSHCNKLEVIPRNMLSNLKKLEALYMERSFNRWEAEGLNDGKERAGLDELKHLQKLSTLEIDIPNASVLPKDLFSESSLERYKIDIRSDREDYFPGSFSRTLRLEANNINMEYGVFWLLENVEDLHLENLKGIASLNQSHITAQISCKLRAIGVRYCDQLRYLFSISMVETLSRLETIKAWSCKSLQEIVTFIDGENVQKGAVGNVIEFLQLRSLTLSDLPSLTYFSSNKVAFPNLETLELNSINCQNIWDMLTSKSNGTQISEIVESSQMTIMSNNPLPYRSFGKLKTLSVINCNFVLKLIPFHILKSLVNLEELWISGCDSLEVVFDLGEFNNDEEIYTFRLKRLCLGELPKLKTVWSRGTQGIVNFQNLQSVSVWSCKSLKSIFPASMVKGLIQLEELQIWSCGAEVVVAKDEFPLDADATVVFPKLRKVMIWGCNDLKIFESEFSDTKYSFFLDEKVIPKLEELSLNGRHAIMMCTDKFRAYHFLNAKILTLSQIKTFPYGIRFPRLEVRESSLKVIFSASKRPLDNDASEATLIEELVLRSMNWLKYIWDKNCQADHTLQNLKTLEVCYCGALITLGPSSVSLENLTELNVYLCGELINLLTPSTARTLVQLTRLKIENCGKIEEIITDEQEDVKKEIRFMKLKILELDKLPSCKSFCSHNYSFNFPLLDEVVITRCPRLRMFCSGDLTTPLLKVKMGGEEIHCQNNLNEAIQRLFDEKVKFRYEDVKIDEYPELIKLWNGKCAVSDCSFGNLTSLVMDKCDFLSIQVIPFHILTFLNNLEILEVSNCDSVEVVFYLEGIDMYKEAYTLQAKHLRWLRLDHLPNLKYVWNKDPHTIHRFQHLEHVSACECQSLRSIFPASIAKGLTNLQMLKIESCGVETIVAEDETPAQTIHFMFPELCELDLVNLPNLKNFYSQRHTIECPTLQFMDVRQCEKLKVFSWEDPKIAEKEAEDEIENQHPLFSFEKVVPMLKYLVLNKDHVRIIRNGQFQDHLFKNVGCLVLDSFGENELSVFPYTFLERFPRLTDLRVSHGCSKEIFPCQDSPSDFSRKLPLPTSLTFTHLDQLQNIWNEDFKIHPFLQNLSRLRVDHCSRLINLAPSSASFDNLHWLRISGCHRLGHLLTISIAKSLVCLGSLVVEDCKMMEEIVTNEGKDVEDIIVLKKLEGMKLINLPVLKNFCSQRYTFEFPLLVDVTIKGCSKMKMFCPGVLITPLLEDVKIEKIEDCWEGNLNEILEQLFLEKVGQSSSEG